MEGGEGIEREERLVVGALGKSSWGASAEPCDNQGLLGKTDLPLKLALARTTRR